ncbi:MAG TPA: hotdog domain-containing protein, partial [bacterium]|nr:hotdog domain-containing protein [bacterium]
NGIDAATAELTVRYREPVRLGQELTVHAWQAGRRGRLLEMESEALRDGKRVASARARCLALPDRVTETQ